MSAVSRRGFLQLAAAGAASLARPGFAEEKRLPRLIEEARGLATISERVAHISRAFVGAPYIMNPLGGGPCKRERLVVREDGFDCVTFCETVLAAARSNSPEQFERELRHIRYRNGVVDWFARNHYFVDWISNNAAIGICCVVALPGAVRICKTLNDMHGLREERVAFIANPCANVFDHAGRLVTGDIVAFVSRRAGLDVFHTGLIMRAADETLWLRHASQSQGRVLDQPLAAFCAASGVQAITLSRPQETIAADPLA